MKDWYQYRPWNLTHRVQLRESRHMTYHTAAQLPNSCGPMADGPFRDLKGRSYLHTKYWTHRGRIDINISHEILPIESRQGNQCTWHILRRHYCNSVSALTIKPWLGAERLLLVSDFNTNKTTTTIIITSGLGRLGFYMDHRVTGSCWRDSWA